MAALTTRDKLRRTGITLVVLACVVGAGFAVANTREIDDEGDAIVERGDPCEVVLSGEGVDAGACDPESGEELGEIVERLYPAADSEALQQVQVGIDLGSLYTGVLVVAGTEVPEDQLERREQLNQVFFSPGEERVVEEWEPGRNCVTAIVWPIAEGRADSRNIDWCFEVT